MDDDKLNFSCSSDNGSVGIIAGMLTNSGADDSAGEEPSFNLRLIDAVRQSRCLYDAADRQYRSADYKIKVWNRLVRALNFQGDARTLYNRWKQLRDKYGKEKKKMKYSGEVSQWQFYKHLEFLDPHMVDRTQQKFERTKDGKYVEASRPIVLTDPNFLLNLVREVRLRPCLFDIHDSKYRQTEYRNQVWSEIIKNLNFPGDINAIYKQWKKIRDRYVREKRKMRMSAGGEQDGPTWDLFRELLWIDPYLEERTAQAKRKRESSEVSDELYLEEFGLAPPNGSTGAIDGGVGGGSNSMDPQHYATILMPSSAGGVPPPLTMIPQHLASIDNASANKLYAQQPGTSVLQTPICQIRTASADTPKAAVANGDALLMQPAVAATSLQLVAPAAATATNPIDHLTAAGQPQQQQPQQQQRRVGGLVTLMSTPQPDLPSIAAAASGGQLLIDGDRAFALSVAADLCALPEHARVMARAQIRHLLENSKITIVKA